MLWCCAVVVLGGRDGSPPPPGGTFANRSGPNPTHPVIPPRRGREGGGPQPTERPPWGGGGSASRWRGTIVLALPFASALALACVDGADVHDKVSRAIMMVQSVWRA